MLVQTINFFALLLFGGYIVLLLLLRYMRFHLSCFCFQTETVYLCITAHLWDERKDCVLELFLEKKG